jgi:hypothetical protein
MRDSATFFLGGFDLMPPAGRSQRRFDGEGDHFGRPLAFLGGPVSVAVVNYFTFSCIDELMCLN